MSPQLEEFWVNLVADSLAVADCTQGFGFISDGEISALAGRDTFVHYTAIRIKVGLRALWVGEEVSSPLTIDGCVPSLT